jgi:hypothetical protein
MCIECGLRSLCSSEITGLMDKRICIQICFKLGKFRTLLNSYKPWVMMLPIEYRHLNGICFYNWTQIWLEVLKIQAACRQFGPKPHMRIGGSRLVMFSHSRPIMMYMRAHFNQRFKHDWDWCRTFPPSAKLVPETNPHFVWEFLQNKAKKGQDFSFSG